MSRRFVAATLSALAVVAIAAASAGYAQHQRSAQVQNDLETAMKGEAFAYAKYMLFAQQARAHGNPAVAALFERTAKTELLEHFKEHAELAGLVSSDAANLQNAIDGESYETSKMYPEMAARAKQAGDGAAAKRFTEIGNDESKHRDAFVAALSKIQRTPQAAGVSRP